MFEFFNLPSLGLGKSTTDMVAHTPSGCHMVRNKKKN